MKLMEKKPIENTYGIAIRAARKRAGLRQKDVADALGMTSQGIHRYERGGASPPLDKLVTMARMFGVSVDGLLGLEQPSWTLQKTG